MDGAFAEAVEHSSQGSAGRSSAPGGGGRGVALPLTLGPRVPSNLHGCYLYIFIYEYMYMQVQPATAPRHGHFERHVGYSPPHFAKFFSAHILVQSVFYMLFGVPALAMCPIFFDTDEGVSRNRYQIAQLAIGLSVP